jgi:hypothetical protein
LKTFLPAPGLASFDRPFSKKVVTNHEAAVALHFMCYNFVRIHQPLRVSPAMAAGVTRKLSELGDIMAMIDAAAPPAGQAWDVHKKRAAVIPALKAAQGEVYGVNQSGEKVR